MLILNVVVLFLTKKVKMLVTQSSLILSNPMDCSPLGSSLAMGFSRQDHWSE